MSSFNNHISFQTLFLFLILKDECRRDGVIQGCSNLEGRLLFSLGFFVFFSPDNAATNYYHHLLCFQNEILFLARETTALSRFKAIAAFQFPLCTFHFAAGRHGAGCAAGVAVIVSSEHAVNEKS